MLKSKEEKAPKISRESFYNALGIFKYIRPYQFYFVAGLILLALSSMVFMIFPYTLGYALDVAQGKGDMKYTLKDISLFLIGVLFAQGFVSYFRVTTFSIVSEKGTADLRKDLYQKLIHLPVEFYEQNRVGDLVSRLTSDVEKLYNVFNIVLAEFLRQIILLIGCVAILAWQNPKLSGIMLLTFPIIVIGAMFFGRFIRRLSKERQSELAYSNTILDETLHSINAVKAFTNEPFEVGRYKKSNDGVVKISLKYAAGRAFFAVFIITMLFGGLFFVIMQAMFMVQKGELSSGEVLSFGIFTAVLGGAIAGLGNFYSELAGAVGATERIIEILNMPSEVDNHPRKGLAADSFKGNIQFRDIKFSYPTRPDVQVLKGINLEIAPGEKVALVGQSGAGKSTIMQLLLQFHFPTSGTVHIDGKDIYDYDLKSYRRNFALVPQEVILFGGTIRENILYGNPDATDEEIISAAKQANAYNFIHSFPEGLDTIVGERGVKLSGGQRQRIAIARAILRNPTILLLDEATSSLDAESEKLVQEALDRLMMNRTSIIIAHRLATIRNVDRIYVLDKGEIAEQGTHDELIEHSNGLYKNLAALQFEN